jgi:hypothetical protein
MPFVYDISLATAGNLTTSGTPATETDAMFLKAGSGRNAMLTEFSAIGKAAAETSITGIAFRCCRFATASTSGTGITPQARDVGAQAAKATCASRPTAGSTRTNRWIVGAGSGGPTGWWAPTPDHYLVLEAGYAGSFDIMDVSGVASKVYEPSAVLIE